MDRELFWFQGGDCQIRVQGIKDAYVIAHRFERAGKWQSGLPSGIEAETIIGWAERLERKEKEEGVRVHLFPECPKHSAKKVRKVSPDRAGMQNEN